MTTDVQEVIDRLAALHAHDEKVRVLEGEIQDGPARLASHKAVVSEIEKKISLVNDRVKILRAQIKLRENELMVAEQKIERVKAQSSEVRSNKEFVAFKAELTNFQADADRLQGETLKIMDVVDQAALKLQAMDEEKARAVGKIDDARARLDESLEDVKKERDQLTESRRALLDGIPQENLQVYERARRSRGGGLAFLESEYCGACMERLTRNDQFAVQNRARLVVCRGCNRIIVPS